ncbi:MAG: hypothetical protein CM15mP103_04980 [Gammaproteobacteria bacterium]|nr:MAG: hypothetical protein CM15mP103_04980 [Gammaproteobacteria bacterium]
MTGLVEAFDTQGFCVIPELLTRLSLSDSVRRWPLDRRRAHGPQCVRGDAYTSHLRDAGQDPVFAELVAHPVSLAWAEHYLGQSCLLSACLAIHLQPGDRPSPGTRMRSYLTDAAA